MNNNRVAECIGKVAHDYKLIAGAERKINETSSDLIKQHGEKWFKRVNLEKDERVRTLRMLGESRDEAYPVLGKHVAELIKAILEG